MELFCAGTQRGMLFYAELILTTVQACQSRRAESRRQVQEIRDAVHPDGKHITLPPSLRTAAPEHAVPRPLPDCRSVRIQRSRPGPTMLERL